MLHNHFVLTTGRLLRISGAVVGLTILAVLQGCSSGGFSERTNANSSGTFRYSMATAPTTLDPAQVQDSETIDLLGNVYEGLVAYDENNKLVGQLAETWEISPNGLTYTFKLRQGVKFHNGHPLTAAMVKKSWERALGSKINSPVATTYLNDIVGSAEVSGGKQSGMSGVVAKDDLTLEVKIDKPRPYFLGKLTYPCAYVVDTTIVPPEGILTVENAAGTGPFKFKVFKPDQVVELDANQDYYLGKPLVTKIIRPVIRDSATRLNKFRNHEIDYLTVEKQEITGVQDDPELSKELALIPRPAIYYLLLNAKQYAPFEDRHVRRAMAMAIDLERIAGKILAGQPSATRWVPNGVLDGPSPVGLKYDPEAARKELALSKFKDGASLPELELTIRADNVDARFISEAVSADLKKNLGMRVQPRSLEWGAVLKARNKAELPCAFLSWFGDYIDAQNFLSFLLLSNSGVNFDKWSNSEFDRLCRAADIEKDPAKRRDLYLKAEQIVLDEVPRIPLYFGQDAVLVSKRVHGLRKNLLGSMPHLKVSVE